MKFAVIALALFAAVATVCAEHLSQEYLPPTGGAAADVVVNVDSDVGLGGGVGEVEIDDGGAVLGDDGYRYKTHRARRIRYRARRYRHRA